MLNLLRGTGLAGLHGIARVSEMSSVVICRPLLEFTRKQIEGYVLAHRVPYRHDSSNFESDYKRNRIRNEVFPIFEKINPSFVRTINREIGYFAEAGSIVEDWCRSQLSDVLFSHPQGAPEISATPLSHDRSDRKPVTISISRLLAREHWKYLLYYILEPYGFNSQTLASVESLLASDRTVSGKRFESADYVLITTSDTLRVVSKEDAPVENGDHIMVVRGEGVYNFNGCRFKVEVLDWSPEMPLKQPAGTLVLDADMLGFPFVCRRWRQGDWMVPFGMKGKKKVSDIFTDLKFDVLQKDSSVIVVDTRTPDLAEQQHVAALLGLRMDDRYKVTHSTREILRITLL